MDGFKVVLRIVLKLTILYQVPLAHCTPPSLFRREKLRQRCDGNSGLGNKSTASVRNGTCIPGALVPGKEAEAPVAFWNIIDAVTPANEFIPTLLGPFRIFMTKF